MTAVDFIVEKLNPLINSLPNDTYNKVCNIMLKAKELERLQIIDAYCDGSNIRISGEEYYKEAYESNFNL